MQDIQELERQWAWSGIVYSNQNGITYGDFSNQIT